MTTAEGFGTQTDEIQNQGIKQHGDGDANLIDKITVFLEQARVDANKKKEVRDRLGPEQVNEVRVEPSTSRGVEMNQIGEAEQEACELILQAEWFRASTELPRGMCAQPALLGTIPQNVFPGGQVVGKNPPLLSSVNGQGITDDEFFHLTCHVEPNLKVKIEKGEFVELEKLLIKDRFKGASQNVAGQRLELNNRGGETYIMPAERENRIMNVRRWEQAFRTYAAIYSQAYPHRAAEIWQYVYVINLAASTYVWENVANYDYTFRQLMACNPLRSWANIYLQMWNLLNIGYILNETNTDVRMYTCRIYSSRYLDTLESSMEHELN